MTQRTVKHTPWSSIAVAGALNFCQGVQYALFFSSLWPYLQTLDPFVEESFLGYVIASYCVGFIFIVPLVGWWSSRTKSVVRPVQTALLFVVVGNSFYFLAPLFPVGRKWIVLGARFLVGFGGCTMSMMHTYSAKASTENHRSQAISIITGGHALGMCIGPALQLLFTPFGSSGIPVYKQLNLNMYTMPAIGGAVVNLFGIGLLEFVFREVYAEQSADDPKKSEVDELPIPQDRFAICICHFTRFTQDCTYANLESLGIPLAMTMFALSRADALSSFASAHGVIGISSLGVNMLFVVVKMDKYFDFRKVCILGFLGFFMYHVLTFSYPFIPGHIKTYTAEEFASFVTGNSTVEPTGCPVDRFSWCQLSPINFWVYLIAFILSVGVFNALINVSNGTILSKVVGPRNQTKHQTIYYMSGTLARLIGPIVITNVYSTFGPRTTWFLEMSILGFTLLLWTVFYSRMISFSSRRPKESRPSDSAAFSTP